LALSQALKGRQAPLSQDSERTTTIMIKPRPVQVIAVSSAKGGVGKSNVCINLAIAMAERGHRVVVFDAGMGLGNVDILLGLTVRQTLSDVLAGRCRLEDILIPGPSGIRIAPAPCGDPAMTRLGPAAYAGVIHAFSNLADQIDVLLIDTSSGMSDSLLAFLQAAQEILLVVSDEPAAIAGSCALMRLMNSEYGANRFRVLASQVRNGHEGQLLFDKLARVTARLTDIGIRYAGAIPYDEAVRKAVQRQKAVLEVYPGSRASVALRALAEKAEHWPLPAGPGGHVEFFLERLVGGGQTPGI